MTNINMKEKEKEEFRSSGSRKEKEGTKVSVPTVHGATFNQTGCLSLTLFIFAYLYMLQQVYALATEWGSVPLKSFKRLHLEVGLDHQVNHNPVQLLNGNLESATVYNSSLPLKQRLRSLEKFDAKALGILVGINVSHSHYWYSENKFNREHAQVKGSFLPGTLPLSRTESLNRCYVDGKRYKYELMNANVCSYAPKYNLFFYMNPKCGSSSGKAIMKKYFGAGDQLFFKDCIDMFFNQTIYGHKGFKVTAVRHPYSRFYSGYEEVMFRKLTQKRFDRVPKDMRRFVHPYMNWTYPEYVDFGNTRKGMKQLANTLETFVEDFHNEKPFDNHLRTQATLFSRKGHPLVKPLDVVLDIRELLPGFREIARRVHAYDVNIPDNEKSRRKAIFRMDKSLIGVEAKRKICRLYALDYCCLNYQLPPECLGSTYAEAAVHCQWKNEPNISEMPMIAPINPPNK